MRYNLERREREREGEREREREREGGYGERERDRERERVNTYLLPFSDDIYMYIHVYTKKSIFIHVAQTIFHGYSKMSLYSMSRPNTLCPV